MSIRLVRIEDVEEAKELHALAFPSDNWAGDDHTYWVARDGKTVVGFCSAVHREEKGYVFLSRAAVIAAARGAGLQRRMIRARVAWAKKQSADVVVTYTTMKNYDSMVNLLKCGFRFFEPDEPFVGKKVHYYRLKIERSK